MKKTILIFAALSLFLGACGAITPTEETPPPLTGEDVQATAISMAWTMAAQTQTAMPTATYTLEPPTATFTPVFTPTPLFTETPIFTATPLATATKEGEIKMLSSWDGPSTKLLIINKTKGPATVSLYLSEGSNERGYYGYIIVPVLEKNGRYLAEGPKQGYYSVFAWVGEGTNRRSVSGGLGTNSVDKHEIHLTDNGVKIVNP